VDPGIDVCADNRRIHGWSPLTCKVTRRAAPALTGFLASATGVSSVARVPFAPLRRSRTVRWTVQRNA
ncbi:MAG TPA: hypothetical protein VGP82_14315, partial [Ktedonobacterales bacterium]|nr:hypothetical protein [Ktedonobacterales bacterium]